MCDPFEYKITSILVFAPAHLLDSQWEKLDKLTTGSRLNFELGDIKAMIAALHLILSSATKYDVEEKVLSLELQQLGLPNGTLSFSLNRPQPVSRRDGRISTDSCSAVCRAYRGAHEKLREHLSANVLQLPRLESTEWRVDHLVRTAVARQVDSPSVRLRLHASQPLSPGGKSAVQAVELSAEQFRVFFSELKTARALMENVA